MTVLSSQGEVDPVAGDRAILPSSALSAMEKR